MMFMDAYKAKHPDVSGQSPAAVLLFHGHPFPHLRIETAYWIRATKAKALRMGALA